jgi:hypothetical protein
MSALAESKPAYSRESLHQRVTASVGVRKVSANFLPIFREQMVEEMI